MSRMRSKRYCTVEQQECQSSKLRIRRISIQCHGRRDGQVYPARRLHYTPNSKKLKGVSVSVILRN